ncbi:MAG: acetylornithine deacetylase [Steroidobacteraceae bacterium]
MLERLIACRTVPEQPNLALLKYVSEHLRAIGVEPTLILEPCGERGGLVALIGPSVPGGILLSAHSDVVSVEGQTWTVPPWQLTSQAGRLYGRGTADMKGFIACCLDLLPRIDVRRLERPLILAITHDEEIGCRGAPMLVRHITAQLPRPSAVIVGEPTSMRVVHGHKGVAVYETRVRGRAAHSSLTHTAASATLAAGQLVVRLGEIAARLRDASRRDDAFLPPYTTVNVGIVRGGEASNIVAAECTLRWDVRPIPGDDPRAVLDELRTYGDDIVLPAMRVTTPEARIATQEFASAPPLAPRGDLAARDLAMRIAGESEASVVSFTTEAGLFQEAGMSAAVCGPGSIDQAHKPDEYVELSQLQACSRFLHGLIESLS